MPLFAPNHLLFSGHLDRPVSFLSSRTLLLTFICTFVVNNRQSVTAVPCRGVPALDDDVQSLKHRSTGIDVASPEIR